MNITDITDSIWKNSEEIAFGNVNTWNGDTFKKKWFSESNIANKWDSVSPGWYWFICNISYEELQDMIRPRSLPSSGCDFGLVSHKNIDTFGVDKLCTFCHGEAVIYNGHEGNVMSRIRTHFILNNNRTGALGIKHYPLSSREWKVKIFTQKLINNLPADIQEQVRRLLNNKTGRCSIESAWRVKNGWPILCKE
jgi:hypothetical protein